MGAQYSLKDINLLGTTSKAIVGMAADAAVMQEKLGLSDEAIGNAGKSSILLGKKLTFWSYPRVFWAAF